MSQCPNHLVVPKACSPECRSSGGLSEDVPYSSRSVVDVNRRSTSKTEDGVVLSGHSTWANADLQRIIRDVVSRCPNSSLTKGHENRMATIESALLKTSQGRNSGVPEWSLLRPSLKETINCKLGPRRSERVLQRCHSGCSPSNCSACDRRQSDSGGHWFQDREAKCFDKPEGASGAVPHMVKRVGTNQGTTWRQRLPPCPLGLQARRRQRPLPCPHIIFSSRAWRHLFFCRECPCRHFR